MAYRQNHDPYNTRQQSPYQQQPQQNDYALYAPSPPPNGNTGVTADYSPQLHNYPSEELYANWDSKSVKSYQSSYTGSQAHLNPYEMSQVPPPVPQMQYEGYAQGPHPIQQPQQYPPRPGMYRDGSAAGWSVVREKLMKRRSVKQVQLFRGNLVLDVPVPSHITPAGKGDIEEFSKMRYTAATCDPDDFMSSRYSLRQYLSGRDTELFIVMTMYNEDEVLFVKTMNAWVIFHFNKCRNSLALPQNSVIKNIGHLCGRTRSKTWGPDGWKKVVVCIVSDGRSKVNKRTLQVLSLVCSNSHLTINSYS
jgi:chitin synthase